MSGEPNAVRAPLAGLDPGQRARVILTQARLQLDRQLWQTALGGVDAVDGPASAPGTGAGAGACSCRAGGDDLSLLLAQLLGDPAPPVRPDPESIAARAADAAAPMRATAAAAPAGLGRNAVYAPILSDASARTGIPAAALAAIVDAEAGRRPDGSWNPRSRNPRSSAAGLGQFLSATWVGMAESRGSHLNALAAREGWLDGRGRVRPDAKGALLATRYDPATAIHAIADYSAQNIARLRKAGIAGDGTVESVSRLAYTAHYMGPADAVKFLTGTLGEARSRILLTAQVGAGAVARRIAQSGSATIAHRDWLEGHLNRNVRPQRYG